MFYRKALWMPVFIPTMQKPHLVVLLRKLAQLIKLVVSGVAPALLDGKPAPIPSIVTEKVGHPVVCVGTFDWLDILKEYASY